MSSAQIRQKLFEYIRFANEKKVRAIYTMVEDEIEEKHDLWTESFTAEMERRVKEIESGKVKGRNRSEVDRKKPL
jgi:hypothetical protein